MNTLKLTAASATPTAGAADQLHVTAVDLYGNTAVAYTGSKDLTFRRRHNGPNGTVATVNNGGSAINFGSTTAITFSSGVASEASSALQAIFYSGHPAEHRRH